MTRILLYAGQGGLGRTSVAAPTALPCPARGAHTIVLSMDIVHRGGR